MFNLIYILLKSIHNLMLTIACIFCILTVYIANFDMKIYLMNSKSIQFDQELDTKKWVLLLNNFVNTRDGKPVKVYSTNLLKGLICQVGKNKIEVFYNSIYDLIKQRNIRLSVNNSLIESKATIKDMHNIDIVVYSIGKKEEYISAYVEAKCNIQNGILHITSTKQNCNIKPIGYIIGQNDTIKAVIDTNKKNINIKTNNFSLFCDIHSKFLEAKIYAGKIRAILEVDWLKQIVIRVVALYLDLSNKKELIYMVDLVKDIIHEVQCFLPVPKVPKKVDVNLNAKTTHCINHVFHDLHAECVYSNKSLSSFVASCINADHSIITFLNDKNQIELYSSDAGALWRYINKMSIVYKGTLQGMIDLNDLYNMYWQVLILNTDLIILDNQIFFSILDGIMHSIFGGKSFMPEIIVEGNLNFYEQVLNINNFIAANDSKIIESEGWIDFHKMLLDINIRFNTKSLWQKIYTGIINQFCKSPQKVMPINIMSIKIYGNLNKPKITKPVRMAMMSHLFSIINFGL